MLQQPNDRKIRIIEHETEENRFYHAIAPFLFVIRMFGMLPLAGIWPNGAVAKVRFRWFYWTTLVTFLVLCFSFLNVYLNVCAVRKHGFRMYTVAPLCTSIDLPIIITLFVLFARGFPDYIQKTNRFEPQFIGNLSDNCGQQQFSRKVRLIGILLVLGALAEHMAHIASAIYSNRAEIIDCNLQVDPVKHYFLRERLPVFSFLEYSVWLIPCAQYMKTALTVNWNFIDIFTTMISKSLSLRFRQFHEQIKLHVDKPMPVSFWRRMRLELTSLTQLLQYSNQKLSNIVLLSCSHNMLHVCIQFFYSFHPKGSIVAEVSFWFSLSFVLTRFLTMMFTAADIDDTARKIASTLFEIPSAYWCSELKSLNELIVVDVYALSGKGFFSLKRALIFAMAAKILVYELVLLDQVDKRQEERDMCDVEY